MQTVSDVGERALIERITARLATAPWVLVGPGDDAAVIEPERGSHDVLTIDAQIEGVHFDPQFMPPDAIGHRALAVNLSDLAAMGARPRAALLSLALPESLDVAVLDGVMDGLLALAAASHVAIIGGNITRSPGPMMIDIAAVGSVRPRRALRRSGARPGDLVYVTGSIGDAMVGLESLRAARKEPSHDGGEPAGPESLHPGRKDPQDSDGHPTYTECRAPLYDAPVEKTQERFLRPMPRIRAGMALGRNKAASACMDLSDGLADAVRQIGEASGVGMTIDSSSLPIAASVRQWHQSAGRDPVSAAVGGGDDYELLFTVRPSWRGRLRAAQQAMGSLPMTRIGVVTGQREFVLRTPEGDRPLPAGYEHFRR